MADRIFKIVRIAALPVGAAMIGAAPLAHADESLRWQEVVGIVQAGNAVGAGTGAVLGGGQPWTTKGGSAVVDLRRGRIKFDVRGLVFAGGNSIGTPGAVSEVKGTLVCDTNGDGNGGNSVLVDTPLVELDAQGDAHFSGEVGFIPVACSTQPDVAFLIRIGAGRWIANGAVLRR